MNYSVGSLVKTRGREWMVLPESSEDFLVLRPIGGGEDEATGVFVSLEKVEPATFSLPDPNQLGDNHSARLLRDAIRLGFRSSAGPFRSFGRLAFEPRSYQLVPLLMALKLNPIRMLIADDVGIGKTVESALIAKEMLDRGEIERMAVVCPPALAEQWREELSSKFHIDAELVLPSTVTKLERGLAQNQSLFERYPYVIVSLDYIKSDRNRSEFLRACPNFVIIDEAHTCAFGSERGGKHQRHQLVADLSKNTNRHMILVTATPHSGNENAFRSLLEFLSPEFKDLPEDLTGTERESHRKRLAKYFIQRRRADIKRYLGEETQFPIREPRDVDYKLSPEYRFLFDKVLAYARESVQDTTLGLYHQRIRWWSALALLRSLASSPVAAAETLRNRAKVADAENPEDADSIGRRSILDQVDDEAVEGSDTSPGADLSTEPESSERRRLLNMAKEADALVGKLDFKLQKAIPLIKSLVDEGHSPIIFCRFIATAEYLAAELKKSFPLTVAIAAVTGTLPHEERVERVKELELSDKRILVATDCLSEGINLQESFDSVMHYDLSWNPTRHEQREGRADRFGQKAPIVKVITYYGSDNQIDGVVLDVLIRKHESIRTSLGISVPVPGNTDILIEALLKGYLLKGTGHGKEVGALLPGMEDYFNPQAKAIYMDWDKSAEREKNTRSIFAQQTIRTDEVTRELDSVWEAIGSHVDVKDFTINALKAFGGIVLENQKGNLEVNLSSTPAILHNALNLSLPKHGSQPLLLLSLDASEEGEVIHISRTHPFIESLANYTLEVALDPLNSDAAKYISARRCGVIRTADVSTITTLIVIRYRYHLITKSGGKEKPLLAEECRLHAFKGMPGQAQWLPESEVVSLLNLTPSANLSADQGRSFVENVLTDAAPIWSYLEQEAWTRSKVLQNSHEQVRTEAKITSMQYRVEPQLPPDILGLYIYLPVPRPIMNI